MALKFLCSSWGHVCDADGAIDGGHDGIDGIRGGSGWCHMSSVLCGGWQCKGLVQKDRSCIVM